MVFSVFRVSLAVLFGAFSVAAQIPASFHVPILGYVFDGDSHNIRPIVGILGNSRIEAPLELGGLEIRQAAILTDQKHAIVSAADAAEALVLDLEEPGRSGAIFGAPSNFSALRT